MKLVLSNRKTAVEVAVIFIAALFFQSCNIKEPTAPNWDVTFNLPIASKSYTLYDIVEKKSNLVQHYTEGDDKDLLYYTRVNQIEKLDVGNEITLDPFSASASQSIEEIGVNSDAVNADVGFNWISPSISPGSFASIPTISNTRFPFNLGAMDQFQYVKIKSGFIDVTFKNYFPSPVTVTINSFSVKDLISGSTIIQNNTPVVLPPQQTSTVLSFPISQGTTVNNQLSIEFNISTGGSGGQKIIVPAKSLSVSANVRDLKVSEANAIIPEQNTIQVSGSVRVEENLSQPSQFQMVVFDGGKVNATITNNLNVDVSATFVIDNLRTPQGNLFSVTQNVPAKSTVNVFPNAKLTGYSIVSPNGIPTNIVSFHVQASVIPTTVFRSVGSADNVTASVDFTNLSITEFTGRMKPIVVEQTRSAISLDLKDVQNDMQFSQINLKNPKVELRFHPTANLSFNVSGRIEAQNSRGEKNSMTLSNRTMNKTTISPSDSVIMLNADSVSKFFGSFKQFPDSIVVFAGGVANPNYDIVSIKKTDRVMGNSSLEIPFHVGLVGGVFTDSVTVDLSRDDRDRIKDMNTLQTNLVITNGIATSINFTGKLYDKYNNFLMYFPPKYEDQDTIVNVGSAFTGSDGSVTSPNIQTINVKFTQGESAKMENAAYMRVKLAFNTPGAQSVKFKTNDVIKIVVSGSTDYHVNPK